ncbi:hypothetical protein HMI54_013724 [Coelomomyces lativittatus]|nr:hypothetical protein HMI55_001579 [Coelomomyces lativittatus]KAJ1518639.1 hypothetical protein HMI54_013724 [Coelomomyces lativittatus]
MKLRAIQNCTGLLRMKDMDHQDTTLHAFDCMENCESLIGIQLVQGKTRGFTRMEDFHGLNVTFNLSCMVQKYPKDSYGFMVFTRDFTFNVLHPEKEFMNALSWENQRYIYL